MYSSHLMVRIVLVTTAATFKMLFFLLINFFLVINAKSSTSISGRISAWTSMALESTRRLKSDSVAAELQCNLEMTLKFELFGVFWP